jgi:hypothetical protein
MTIGANRNVARGQAVAIGLFRPPDPDELDNTGEEPRPTIEDVRGFMLRGDRDDFVSIDLPHYCRRIAQTTGNAARRPMTHVVAWGHQRGLVRLYSTADVRAVCQAHATLLATGSEHVTQLEEWRYKVQARDGSKPLTVRHVEKADRNRLLGLAEGLGLSLRTAGAVAVVFGLVDAPNLPGELPELLKSEVRAFLDAVRRRALIARDLAERAQQSPAPVRQLSWSEVIRED